MDISSFTRKASQKTEARTVKVIVFAAIFTCIASAARPERVDDPPPTPAGPMIAVTSSKKFGPPYPFTAEELWDKLLYLINIDDHVLRLSDLEAKFDMHFGSPELPSKLNPLRCPRYSVKSGEDWYFSMSFIQCSGKKIQFNFDESEGTDFLTEKKHPLTPCINPKYVEKTLKDSGWIEDSPLQNILGTPFAGFHKSKMTMGILFSPYSSSTGLLLPICLKIFSLDVNENSNLREE